MTKTKSTKRALLMSALALLMCVSMLIGSTFAWFTDSVTSGVNKITAGNLDVELDYYTGSEWKTVGNATELFTGNLWEPGHTEVVYLRMTNKGTLAVKYQLGVNIVSETTGTNVYDDTLKLSDYIYYDVIENKQPSYADRTDAIAAVNDEAKISEVYSKSGTMTTQNEELYLALVVYMPETVGNEANYKTGTTAPEINLGINLLATQYTYESDSFNNQYDVNAEYTASVSTAAELAAALKQGGKIKVLSDITLDSTITVPAGVTANLDLGGNTVTSSVTAIKNEGTLTITNGTIDVSGSTAQFTRAVTNTGTLILDGGSYKGTSALYSYTIWNGGTLTANDAEVIGGFGGVSVERGSKAEINDGTYTVTSNGGGHAIIVYSNANLVINGGTFKGGIDEYTNAYDYLILAQDGSSVKINGGTFEKFMNAYAGDKPVHGISNIKITGGTFAVSPEKYGTVADGYMVTESDSAYVVSVNKENVCTAESFADALAEGGDVKVTANITVDSTMTVAEGVTVNLDLGGNTITSSVTAIKNEGTLTITNGTIDVSGSTAQKTRAVTNTGTLTLDGGSYKGTSALYSYTIWNGGTLTANDAEVIGGFGGVSVERGSKAEINDGTYTVTSNGGGHAIIVYSNANLVINGGTFKGGIDEYTNAYDYLILAQDGSSVKINGGTFEKFMNAYAGDKPVHGISNIEITGGTFAVSPEKYGTIADGYAATENNGVWTVAAE